MSPGGWNENLFVGNMSFQTTEANDRAVPGFGQVTRVHVAMDRETGRVGACLVEMPMMKKHAKAIAA